MSSRNIYLLAFLLFFVVNRVESSSYLYEKRILEGAVIHIVTVNPSGYNIKLVKSNDGKGGRENVPSMAKRTKAEIAINAGFFEIGGAKDGMPSGTLVIEGKSYNIKKSIQSLLIIDKGRLSIKRAKPNDYNLSNISMVSGIPFLIKDGTLNVDLTKNKSEFFTKHHARTAIGTKLDGTIVLIVVEHDYKRDLTSVTMGEVQSLLKEKNAVITEKYNYKNPEDMCLRELKAFLKTEFSSADAAQGLSLFDLAQFMKKIGCHDAVNLDGGGSSTLWVKSKILNRSIGDADEGNGRQMMRDVSDAIVFIPK